MSCEPLGEAMRRREFITLLFGAAVAGPFAARAEPQEQKRLIGVLMGYAESDSEGQAQIAAFKDGLRSSGGRRITTLGSRLAGRHPPMRRRCSDPRRN